MPVVLGVTFCFEMKAPVLETFLKWSWLYTEKLINPIHHLQIDIIVIEKGFHFVDKKPGGSLESFKNIF